MNTPTPKPPGIVIPDLCQTHAALLVKQAGYGPNDGWRALMIVSNIALFQAATCDPKVYKEIDGNVENIARIGCLACRKPDSFGEVVEAAKTHDLGKVKALGEKWIAAARTDKPGEQP